MDNTALSGVGGFLQGLNSQLGPALEHKHRIEAADQLAKKQQEYAAIRRRAEKNPDILKDPRMIGVYRDALGIGEGKSKPEDITEFLTKESPEESAGTALRSDLTGGGDAVAPVIAQAGGMPAAPTGPAVTQSSAPAPAPVEMQQAPVPSAPTSVAAPIAAPETSGQRLKRRIQETAAEPQGAAIIGMAFGPKIGTLSLGEKKLALQAQKQGQPKTIFREFKTGDRVQSFAITVDPNGDFHANQLFDAPRFKPGLLGGGKFSTTSANLALIAEGVSKEDIQTGNIPKDVAKRVGDQLKVRKDSIRERFISEYNARKAGQPNGSGDPKLAAFSNSDIKKGAVGAVSLVQSLMDDEDADAMDKGAPAVPQTGAAPGQVQPFIPQGYPGAGPAGPPITIQTIRKK